MQISWGGVNRTERAGLHWVTRLRLEHRTRSRSRWVLHRSNGEAISESVRGCVHLTVRSSSVTMPAEMNRSDPITFCPPKSLAIFVRCTKRRRQMLPQGAGDCNSSRRRARWTGHAAPSRIRRDAPSAQASNGLKRIILLNCQWGCMEKPQCRPVMGQQLRAAH
jgi:hypothetical protein